MMSTLRFVAVLLVVTVASLASQSMAFAPPSSNHHIGRTKPAVTTLNMGFFNEKERNALTRDSEPEEYFQTNTDKMTDEEKLPIAVMGLVGISAPFILGLIALYAAQG